MTYHRMISTTVLFMLLGTALPAFAQQHEEEKHDGGGKAPQAQHQARPQHAEKAAPQQHAQKAEPQRAEKAAPQQHAQKAEPQRAEKAMPQHQEKIQTQRAQKAPQTRERQPSEAYNRGNDINHDRNNNQGKGNYGRISNANYNSHFGHDHSFHMGRPEMIGGYNRFHYGGYWFGYNQGWPIGWSYDDNCYVVFENGGYYMYDLMHPGVYISLNIF